MADAGGTGDGVVGEVGEPTYVARSRSRLDVGCDRKKASAGTSRPATSPAMTVRLSRPSGWSDPSFMRFFVLLCARLMVE